MLRIIYPQPGGPIAIITPVQVEAQDGETAEEALLRHARTLVPEGTPVAVVDAGAMPADRTWRNAWTMDSGDPGSVTVDMALAREVHRTRLRAARAPLLAELDTAFMRAMEGKDDKAMADIAARKQALRDAPGTASIAAAATPDVLVESIGDGTLRQGYEKLFVQRDSMR